MLVTLVFAATEGADRIGSMALYFLVAVAIIGPYGLLRVRRIRRERAELAAERAAELAALAPPTPSGSSSAGGGEREPQEVPADDLRHAFAAIEAGTASDEDEFEVAVPARPRLNGHPADPATVEALLQDALRRSGVAVITEHRSPDGRVLTCRRGA